MNIKLVVFDWSGVISDDRKPVYAAANSMLKEHNKQLFSSFEEFFANATMTPVEYYVRQGISDDPKVIFEMYKKHYSNAIKSGITPKMYPDVRDVLHNLKNNGKKLAVLSSHPTESLKSEANKFGVEIFFDLISGNSENKVDGLETICIKLSVDPKDALYVGDMIYDVRAAKHAGIFAGGICTGYHTKEMLMKEEPDFLLENLSELKNIIT